ncbi:M55 family metallopeptidase [Streptomyces sp. NPDC052036]|uniref:M55 family metallopeptidase n=1 Tax=Streptomyces sp. NPDC052036 TaxID=3155171 RepID=UPI00341805B8
MAVKYARGRFAAELRPEAEARQTIEEAVTAALAAPREPVPAPAGPSALTVRWQSASVPATLLGIPGVTATDSRTVRAEGELPALYRLFDVWMRVATSLTDQPPHC